MKNLLLFVSLSVVFFLVTTATATAPVANFSVNKISGAVPLTVSFSDLSSNAPTGWTWYFGDENFTAPWTLMNASAGWEARMHHSSVVMPDGSIVLMGGDVNGGKNDTWRSTDNGATWTLVNASSGWSERYGHSSVVMPDGSIVLMGGCYGDGNCRNDTWRSMDGGVIWMLMNASSGWSGRGIHSSVAMPDGSIVLMGGFTSDPFLNNDVWRSRDYGATWTLVNASPGWLDRRGHSSVVMPDSSIVLMGGDSSPAIKNDVWKSMDNGATWTQITANAEWSGRVYHSSVVMPDGSILLMGGWSFDDLSLKNDTWLSTDNGHMWVQVNASSGWAERRGHSSLVMPDGSIVLIGGEASIFSKDYKNDVWRFLPTVSSVQNPSHTYTKPGSYQVTLQVYNADGYNSIRKTGYIFVSALAPVGVFRASASQFIFNTLPVTRTTFGLNNDIPITGDWNGDNITDIGVFRPSTRQFIFNTSPITRTTFGINTDIPITGYWNNDCKTDIGVFRPSTRQFIFNTSPITRTTFGLGTDIPITGDWNGDGTTDIGVFRPSMHQFIFNTAPVTRISFGLSTDIPITGDWNNDGITDIGVFRPSTRQFIFNTSPVSRATFGLSTDIPIVGKWD